MNDIDPRSPGRAVGSAAQGSWRKSTHSGHDTDCVEVAGPGNAVAVRDTKNHAPGNVIVTLGTWANLVTSIKRT